MHHTRHHTSHPQQSEVLLRHIDTNLVNIPQTGEEEACKAPDEQRGCKRTAATTTTIRGRSGDHLCQQYQRYKGYQHNPLTSKQRIVQNLVPICFRPPVQQEVDAAIALTIESREQEDEQTQHRTADSQTNVRFILETGKHILTGTHHPDEIERHQTAGDA